MKVEKIIKIAITCEMDGMVINTYEDIVSFHYDDDPAKFIEAYREEVDEYYGGYEENLSMKEFFEDNWEELVHIENYYDLQDVEDILDFAVDYYKDHVIKDILENEKN